ncbi:MAG TPA: ribosomal protein S18-alanine N-acetyltransferase [Candidatus Acidoferrales bacterium]|nr:ribosomal protein S18-alanine N-acetyltransferase [Candidatus Acidoferrales bacterium]
MSIRAIAEPDVASILAIQSASPEIAQWTTLDYTRVARGDMAGWVAEAKGEVAGFLVARRVASDLEILNFAVRPEARRTGIGKSLLQAALAWGGTFHARNALLEVRASNLAALRFYERSGFEVTGRRPRYYAAPIEDALVLTATLS